MHVNEREKRKAPYDPSRHGLRGPLHPDRKRLWPEGRNQSQSRNGCMHAEREESYDYLQGQPDPQNKIAWISLLYHCPKIVSNRRRDRRVSRKLRQDGWSVLRVWECRIGEEQTPRRIMRALGRSVSDFRST